MCRTIDVKTFIEVLKKMVETLTINQKSYFWEEQYPLTTPISISGEIEI